MTKKLLCLLVVCALCASMLTIFTACKKDTDSSVKPDAFVIMTEKPDGLFNPFFSTSASDGTIVSMTQIGMLSSKCIYNDDGTVKTVEVSFGENEAVVTLDYEMTKNENGDSVYTFVIKKDILFSDGHPLTIEDVLFNLYVYLDPSYIGSSTIYSTAIKGLNAYVSQNPDAGDDYDNSAVADEAEKRANTRLEELITVYNNVKESEKLDYVLSEQMRAAIEAHSPSYGYMEAIMTDDEMYEDDAEEKAKAQLLADYNRALELFEKELSNDFDVSKEAFVNDPFKAFSEFQDEIFCFFAYEGYVTIHYKDENTDKIDRNVITSLEPQLKLENYTTKEAAVKRVFDDMISESLPFVLGYSASTSPIINENTANNKNNLRVHTISFPSVSE